MGQIRLDNVMFNYEDVKYLADDEMFYSSMYSNEYEGISIQSSTSWLGRKVYGNDWSDKEVCEDLLLDYLTGRNYEGENNYFKNPAFAGSVIKYLGEVIKNITYVSLKDNLLIEEVSALNNDYYDLMDYYFILRENSENPIRDEYMKAISDRMDEIKIIVDENEVKFKGLRYKITKKFKFPEPAYSQSLTNRIDRIGTVCDAVSIARAMEEGVNDYQRFNNNLEVIGANIELLSILEENAEDEAMRKAAGEFRERYVGEISNLKFLFNELKEEAGGDIVIFVGSQIFAKYLEKCSPYILILNTGITLGNLISGYSETALIAMRTYEIGGIPKILVNEFRELDYRYSSYGSGRYVYYSNRDIADKLYEDIILTRIFAEEEMILLEESGSGLVKGVGDLTGIGVGKNRKKIIADCKEMIEKLKGL